MTHNTEPTDEELRRISNSPYRVDGYRALYAAGRVAGLEEAATIADGSVTTDLLPDDDESNARARLIAARIRARLGDTG